MSLVIIIVGECHLGVRLNLGLLKSVLVFGHDQFVFHVDILIGLQYRRSQSVLVKRQLLGC